VRIPRLRNAPRAAFALRDPSKKLTWKQSDGNVAVTLPAKPDNDYDTVLVLQLDGAPRVDPPIVSQGSDSPFELDYQDAVTSGKAVKRFNRDGKFHIAKWTGPGDAVSWNLQVSQAGVYHVRIRYAAPPASSGARYAVSVAGRKLTGTV